MLRLNMYASISQIKRNRVVPRAVLMTFQIATFLSLDANLYGSTSSKIFTSPDFVFHPLSAVFSVPIGSSMTNKKAYTSVRLIIALN